MRSFEEDSKVLKHLARALKALNILAKHRHSVEGIETEHSKEEAGKKAKQNEADKIKIRPQGGADPRALALRGDFQARTGFISKFVNQIEAAKEDEQKQVGFACVPPGGSASHHEVLASSSALPRLVGAGVAHAAEESEAEQKQGQAKASKAKEEAAAQSAMESHCDTADGIAPPAFCITKGRLLQEQSKKEGDGKQAEEGNKVST